MTTEAIVSVPEYLNWTTRVFSKGPTRSGKGWDLCFATPLPGSSYETHVYPRDPAIMIYPDIDGAPAVVKHSKTEPDGTVTNWESNVVETGDVVAIQLHRDTFKATKQDGSPSDPNYATSYFWELTSIVPSDGQVEAGAPTPPRPPAAGTPPTGHPAPTPPAFQVEGVVKGHCEKIVAQLTIAKLLPGIEAEDGGIDWEVFRTYRDLYYHNVSNVPVEPLVGGVLASEEIEEEEV
jgi:hypothetical protein